MSRIAAKRRTRATIFYICLFVAIALMFMNWGYIVHGIITVLNAIVGAIPSHPGS